MNKILCKFNNPWKLTLIPHREKEENQIDPYTLNDLVSLNYLTVDASVPGNFELDLYKAGIEPDPFYAQNSKLCAAGESGRGLPAQSK